MNFFVGSDRNISDSGFDGQSFFCCKPNLQWGEGSAMKFFLSTGGPTNLIFLEDNTHFKVNLLRALWSVFLTLRGVYLRESLGEFYVHEPLGFIFIAKLSRRLH